MTLVLHASYLRAYAKEVLGKYMDDGADLAFEDGLDVEEDGLDFEERIPEGCLPQRPIPM